MDPEQTSRYVLTPSNVVINYVFLGNEKILVTLVSNDLALGLASPIQAQYRAISGLLLPR